MTTQLTRGRSWLLPAGLCALASLFCFGYPMYVIRPFRPQGPREFPVALALREAGPPISAVCLLLALVILLRAWPRLYGAWSRAGLVVCVILAAVGAWLTRINVFEMMFHPYGSASVESPQQSRLEQDDMVMSVSLGGEAHAYPIGAMGYHHIVNDTVGGVPVAATYCTLCHTGLIWNRLVDGRILTFRLAGIRNGNALLRDEETNSIWQQTTGIAVFGALKGKRLALVHSDELTFALWRAEQPGGLVLKPNPEFAALYEKKDWEKSIAKLPSIIDTSDSGIAPRELMLGIEADTSSKAFPWAAVLSARLIQDHVGPVPVLLRIGPDGVSARAFRIDPNATFVAGEAGSMIDAGTSSVWNFTGCAVKGPLTGHCLPPIDTKKDYWFDWRNYHPSTEVYGHATHQS